MDVLFLTNNDISLPLAKWIEICGDNVIVWNNKIDLKYINSIKPDVIISYNYKYIIKNDIIHRMNNRIINLHISLLPWNRGSYPNFWSFIDNTPKGVSIIIIDEGIDTGNILFNREIVLDEANETFNSSYIKLHEEIQNLFKENWHDIKKWNVKPVNQVGQGSLHFDKDYENVIKKMDNFNWNMNVKKFKKLYANLLKNI